MRRINYGQDFIFNVDDYPIGERFVIKFYTTDKNRHIRKTSENVIVENDQRLLKMNWSEFATLGDGVINVEVNNLTNDEDFDDNIFNNVFTRTTDYYLVSTIPIQPDEEQTIQEIIAEYMTTVTTIAADFDLKANVADVYTKSQIDTLVDGLDGEIDALDAKVNNDITTAIASEAQRSTAADSELSANINTEIARATAKENEISATLGTAISDEISRSTAADSQLTADIATLTERVNSNKTSTDNAIAAEAARATTKENKFQSDLNELTSIVASNKSTTDAALGNEAATRQLHDNILSSRLDDEIVRATTEENDIKRDLHLLTNTVNTNKTSTDNAIAAETARATAKEDELTAKINAEIARATAAEDEISASIPTKVSELENDALYLTQTQYDYNYYQKSEVEDLIAEETDARVRNCNSLQNQMDALNDLILLEHDGGINPENISGYPQQITIENARVKFANDAVWECGNY